MSDSQETFRTLLERYRDGRYEAPYTVGLLEGLHIEMEPDGKKRLLDRLWDELLCDFQKAVQGETVLNWIFPVAIPFLGEARRYGIYDKELAGATRPAAARGW